MLRALNTVLAGKGLRRLIGDEFFQHIVKFHIHQKIWQGVTAATCDVGAQSSGPT
jgi:hypothetical protein